MIRTYYKWLTNSSLKVLWFELFRYIMIISLAYIGIALNVHLKKIIYEKVREEYKADENRKHDQKINKTMTKDNLIAMFIRKVYSIAIRAFDDVVSATIEIIRTG